MTKDMVILLLGKTGVGKSTFINSVAGSQVAETGNDTESCTKDIRDYDITLPFPDDTRVHLIDTPGLNDTWDNNVQVIEKIRSWLVKFYKDNTSFEFAGILYLYDINQVRDIYSSIIFKNLEYPPLVQNLHIVLTHWSSISSTAAMERLQELQEFYWRTMLERGAQVSRFGNSTESATAIISQVLSNSSLDFKAVLQQLSKIHQDLLASRKGFSLKNISLELLRPFFNVPQNTGKRSTRVEVQQENHFSTVSSQGATSSTHQRTTIIEHEAHVDVTAKHPSSRTLQPATHATSAAIEHTYSVAMPITEPESAKTTLMEEGCNSSSCSTSNIQLATQRKADDSDALQESHRITSTSVTQTASVTGSQIFANSRDFGISGAVMNDGANSTVNYHHTDTHTNTTYNNDTHIHFHFNQPLDPEMKDLVLKGIEVERSKGDAELDTDGVHIHKRPSYVTGSSKKQ